MSKAKSNHAEKLRFTEWRPIGVCDNAPPGIQKAQMFTREDFLIVTGDGVNRDNWQQHSEVKKIVQRYAKRLEKLSSTTKSMKRPLVSKISLVGAIMHLSVTPNLNRESEDGKLQLFQIEFSDGGLKRPSKNRKWLWGLIGVLGLIVLLLVGLLAFQLTSKNQSRRRAVSAVQFGRQVASHCGADRASALYSDHLNLSLDALTLTINQLSQQDQLYTYRVPNCAPGQRSLSQREKALVTCYYAIKENGSLQSLDPSERERADRCYRKICARPEFRNALECY